MKLQLQNQSKLSEISEEFQSIFPALKLVFFHHPHLSGHGSEPQGRIDQNLTLSEARIIQSKGDIEVSEEMTVAELEQAFSYLCGLSVQVFRKSGKNWLQTTASDQWTLKKQNFEGLENEKLEISKAEDYGLQDPE
ncbi:MAG: hypothetical protein RLZZ46_1049 [Bacteroidota bacterium]|jgi:hypothetical protein